MCRVASCLLLEWRSGAGWSGFGAGFEEQRSGRAICAGGGYTLHREPVGEGEGGNKVCSLDFVSQN